MEIIEKDGNIYMKVVYKSPVKSEEIREWLFKEMLIGEFLSLTVTDELIKGATVLAQNTKPIIYMINVMMIEGEKIDDKTPNRIFGHLKNELADFLV